MKKSYLVLFISFLLFQLSSCSEEVRGEFEYSKDYSGEVKKACKINYRCKTELDLNSIIRLDAGDDPFKVNPIYQGDKTVFTFEAEFMDDPDFGDDEVVERVQFQIEKGKNNFYYKDAQLEQINALYTRKSYTTEHGFIPIRQGIIEGHKQSDGTWSVFIHYKLVTRGKFPDPVNIAFDLEFKEG